jgi:hypothetical protein
MPIDERYVKYLEDTLSKFLAPLRDIPFPIVIKVISGHSVISFDRSDNADVALLERLTKAMQKATNTAHRVGIFTNRPNEVGNHIEPFVRDALRELGISATIPRTKRGIHRSAGYPDIEMKDIDGRITYLECKTCSLKSEDSSFRAFYMQPSEDAKITADARHLLVGFEIESQKRGLKDAYVPVRWRLYTLENLRVQVKHEFNASNQHIYQEGSLLARGAISWLS